jgi:tRNA (guanine-N(7)-)-methyltransferase subunit TRM82
MFLPYQSIKRCGKVLVAARGSSIDTFNLEVGSLLSALTVSSTQDPKTANSSSEKAQNTLQSQMLRSSEDVVLQSSPPAKRRKLSAAEEDGSAQESNQKNGSRKEEKGSKKCNKRLDAVASGLETPAVILLAATGDGRHVIAVTGEDKSIRVFQHDLGELEQLSQRSVTPIFSAGICS